MISHANIINQLRQMRQYTPVGISSTVLGILPFYHSTCLFFFFFFKKRTSTDIDRL